MPLNLIVLGPPGAGKGTQAERLARVRRIPQISTGDILREAVQAGTEIGRRVKAIMDRGELVDDDTITGIVRERLMRPDAAGGFVLDGFPRTVTQANSLDAMMEGRGPLVVVDVVVPEAELIRRLSTRLICANCGANADDPRETTSWPAENLQPRLTGDAAATEAVAVISSPGEQRCRRCGGQLVQRSDDSEPVVRERLNVYQRQTKPIVEYYRARPTFRVVNGAQPLERVAAELAAAVDSAVRGARS